MVRLPLPDAGRTLQYWQLYATDDIVPAPLSVDSISIFLCYALFLTAWKQFQGNTRIGIVALAFDMLHVIMTT
jgi:hypothetical protein